MKNNRVIFRFDASKEIGYGHLFRCLALAEDLMNLKDIEVDFAMIQSPSNIENLITNNQKKINIIKNFSNISFNEEEFIFDLVAKYNPACIVFDIRTNLKATFIKKLKENKILLIGIDDSSERRLEYDINFYPPVKKISNLNWHNYKGKNFIGWKYIPLRNEFKNKLIKRRNSKTSEFRLLLSMGGSDPNGLTIKCLEAIKETNQKIFVDIIIGPGFKDMKRLTTLLKSVEFKFILNRNLSSKQLSEAIKNSNFALVTYGMIAFEILAIGIPALHISLTPDHYESAKSFSGKNVSINFGLLNQNNFSKLVKKLKETFQNKNKINSMKINAKKLAYELSGEFVAKEILKQLFENKN